MEVTVSAVGEVKSFGNPPQTVKQVLELVLLLLGYSEQQSKRWENAAKCMSNPRDFISRLNQLDPTNVPETTRQRAEESLRQLSVAQVRAVSSAAATIYAWVEKIVS